MEFFVGLHQPSDARHFERCFISVNRLRSRKTIGACRWIMDSGAFTEVSTHGGYRTTPEEYAAEIRRWAGHGELLAAVAQDWMCEPFVLAKTGLAVADHQRLTIERYDALIACDTGGVYIMPVLQGWHPHEYVRHIEMYGDRLPHGAWVGVGSICKRNSDPRAILFVLGAIKAVRPDLRPHAFGLKLTALRHRRIRSLVYSADSMSWSYSARKQGRSGNSWIEARAFELRVNDLSQPPPAAGPLFQLEMTACTW